MKFIAYNRELSIERLAIKKALFPQIDIFSRNHTLEEDNSVSTFRILYNSVSSIFFWYKFIEVVRVQKYRSSFFIRVKFSLLRRNGNFEVLQIFFAFHHNEIRSL